MLALLLAVVCQGGFAQPAKRILFVLTSHGVKGSTGEPTGFYLSEVSHPYEVLSRAGAKIDFVSPKGGRPPVDGLKLDDPVNRAFWENPDRQRDLDQTMRPEQVKASDYDAIFFAGGHGTMWDFADNTELAEIAAEVFESGGVVAAVCHGPAGLLNIKLENGRYLIADREVTGFSNEEEEAAGLTDVVPFLLADELSKKGARYSCAPKFEEHLVVDGRLVTGQNPASAKAVGQTIARLLELPVRE